MQDVITYQSPGGARINLTPRQADILEGAGVWPRDARGREFCSVSHGEHYGRPTWTDEQIATMARGRT